MEVEPPGKGRGGQAGPAGFADLGLTWVRGGQHEFHQVCLPFVLHSGLKSVEVELAPPFTISGSMRDAGGGTGYMQFHDRGI